MTRLTSKLVTRLYDRLWRAPQGLGVPISATAWDRAFASGKWEYLRSMSEVAHYSAIHGYAAAVKSPASIIDIGCGPGILRSCFREEEITRYTGVDVSSEAIRMCGECHFPSSQFIVADFDEYMPEVHDIVIFNESIGYARDPAATFRRYWAVLPIGGACIISMHKYGTRSWASWRRIERCTKPIYTTRLINEKQQAWDVKVFLRT